MTRPTATTYPADRRRRLIYNDDSDQQFTAGPHALTDEQSFIDARTTPAFGSHVDTYVWCVGNGADPPWGGERYAIDPLLGSCARATELIVEACHRNRVEVWGSLRINDLHDAQRNRLEDTHEPLKATHPELLVGDIADRQYGKERIERTLWAALNFEHAQVRQYRLDYVARNAAAHDFDGYELDFSRFPWSFPQGRERQLAPLMTGFVRGVRGILDDIADRRGRPYTLVAHVMDTPELSLNLGQDVERWAAEGLVDVVVAGMGFCPFTIDLGMWKEFGARYDLPVYPSLNTRPFGLLYRDRLDRQTLLPEFLRGVATWWWREQVDGIYLFNLFSHAEMDKHMDRSDVYAPLLELGDPEALDGRQKVYAVDMNNGMFNQGVMTLPLPCVLDIHERRLPLCVSDEARDPRARFALHIWTQGGAGDKLLARLNHHLLKPERAGDHHTVEVPGGLLKPGRNELTLFCGTELASTASPSVAREILLSVTY